MIPAAVTLQLIEQRFGSGATHDGCHELYHICCPNGCSDGSCQSRPESRKGKQDVHPYHGSESHDEIDFEGCLTQCEHDAYMKYQRDYPGSVYSLNQNPDTRATCAKQSGAQLILF